MSPIFHNIDPFILRLGENFGIRWYSLPYMLGMMFVYLSLKKAVREDRIPNLTEEGAENFVLSAILGALIGARFFHVFVFEFDRYGIDPLAWIAVWRGGLAFHGGLVGVLTAVVWHCHRNGVRIYHVLDRITIPVVVALGLGRIANFINAEMYGTPYDGPFCIDYSQNQFMSVRPEGCRHPTQLYEATKNFGVAGFLLFVRERLAPPPGVVFWSFITLYGWIRFGLMYLRDEDSVWGTLTLSQIFSGMMGIAGGVMLVLIFTGVARSDDNGSAGAGRTTGGVEGAAPG